MEYLMEYFYLLDDKHINHDQLQKLGHNLNVHKLHTIYF